MFDATVDGKLDETFDVTLDGTFEASFDQTSVSEHLLLLATSDLLFASSLLLLFIRHSLVHEAGIHALQTTRRQRVLHQRRDELLHRTFEGTFKGEFDGAFEWSIRMEHSNGALEWSI